MTDNRDLLARVSEVSTETEYFSPIPTGYEKGRGRYVIVMGTVMSGLGKGIFSSCLAKLMQDKGLKVAPIKLEGYLNIDSKGYQGLSGRSRLEQDQCCLCIWWQ